MVAIRKNRNRNKKVGLPPGSVIFTGNRKVETVGLHLVRYSESALEEEKLELALSTETALVKPGMLMWLDVRGIHDTERIEIIGKAFGIHPLVLEDVTDVHHRPKFEEYENDLFLIVKALHFEEESSTVNTEHVSIYMGKGFTLSFQESETDLFQSVRQRLRNQGGKSRQRGSDYLVYALLDLIADNYYPVLDSLEEQIDLLEEKMLIDQMGSDKARIHFLQKQILTVRRSILPTREAITRFISSQNDIIDKKTKIFLRDINDHMDQLLEMAESMKDTLTGLHELFNSEVSLKMNQVMKLLTLVAAIFIPLTFLAGVYGMNFRYIPGLEWRHGFLTLMAVMSIIAIILLVFFQRKKWL